MCECSSRIFVIPKVILLASLLTIASGHPSHAADIIFLCANALRPAMNEIIPAFQNASGHNVKLSYAILGVNTDRIRKGDAADLAIVSPQQWEDLKNEGKLDLSTRSVIAKVGIGVFVKKGAARPDISSVEAFKRTFVNARSIAVPLRAGDPVGVYAVGLFDRLGITAELVPKNVVAGGGSPIRAVARGDAEIGFQQISEIVAEPGVDFVGPMPTEIQNYTVFTAAAPANSKERGAAKAFIEFLTSARAIAILKSKGLDPA
jgi:molybdate transport system substrate-binding protein